MLKRGIILGCAFLTLMSKGFSGEIQLEAKASYYYPTSTHFRSIYPGAGLYRLEANFETVKGLFPFLSAGYFYQSGRSSQEDRTHIQMVPLTAGLVYQFQLKNLRPYLGAGVPVTYVHIKNKYDYVDGTRNRWTVGGQGRVGFLYFFKENLFFDFFGDYTYLKWSFGSSGEPHVDTRKADLSGISVGAGFGGNF